MLAGSKEVHAQMAKSPCSPEGTAKAVPPGKRDCDTIWVLKDFLNEVLLTIETFYFYSMWKSLMAITIDAQHLVGQDACLGVET